MHAVAAWPYDQWMVLILCPGPPRCRHDGHRRGHPRDEQPLTTLIVVALVVKLAASFARYYVAFSLYGIGDAEAVRHDRHGDRRVVPPGRADADGSGRAAPGHQVHRRPHRVDLRADGPEPVRWVPRLLVHRLLGLVPVPPCCSHRGSGGQPAPLRRAPVLPSVAGVLAVEHRQGGGDDAVAGRLRLRRGASPRTPGLGMGVLGDGPRLGLHGASARARRGARSPRRCRGVAPPSRISHPCSVRWAVS